MLCWYSLLDIGSHKPKCFASGLDNNDVGSFTVGQLGARIQYGLNRWRTKAKTYNRPRVRVGIIIPLRIIPFYHTIVKEAEKFFRLAHDSYVESKVFSVPEITSGGVAGEHFFGRQSKYNTSVTFEDGKKDKRKSMQTFVYY